MIGAADAKETTKVKDRAILEKCIVEKI